MARNQRRSAATQAEGRERASREDIRENGGRGPDILDVAGTFFFKSGKLQSNGGSVMGLIPQPWPDRIGPVGPGDSVDVHINPEQGVVIFDLGGASAAKEGGEDPTADADATANGAATDDAAPHGGQ